MTGGRLAIAVLVAAGCAAPSATGAPPASPRRATRPSTTTTAGVVGLVPLTLAPHSHAASYDRAVDFGAFTDQRGCEDTRAVVLVRTSTAPVTFTSTHDCTVARGRWTDPWSGVVTTVARAFQIDHTVPLANAWMSGAWAWSHTRRVSYANDLTDPDHLVPILAAENESKGDDGPDGWRPPRRGAWCRYALAWDHIKAKWHLTATAPEWAAIRQMAGTCPPPG